MIIYKDILTDDEILSDSYDIKSGSAEGLWEIDCKKIAVGGESFDIGANPSAEEEEDGVDSNVEQVIDLVHSFRLVYMEAKPTKKVATAEYKKYAKGVLEALKAKGKADQAKLFQSTAGDALKKVLGNWDNYDVFTGESMGEVCHWVLIDYREDGVTPFATVWRYAFDEMKV